MTPTIVIKPIMKFICLADLWVCLFYTEDERITLSPFGNDILLSTVYKKDKAESELIGILREGKLTFADDYIGDARSLTTEIFSLSRELKTLVRQKKNIV